MVATLQNSISVLAKVKHAIETNFMKYIRDFADMYNMGEKKMPKNADKLLTSYCDFLSKSFDDLTNDLKELGISEEHYNNLLIDIKEIRELSDHIRKILDLEKKYSILQFHVSKLLEYLEKKQKETV